MRYVMRIFDTPLLEFEASYGEGLQAHAQAAELRLDSGGGTGR